MAPKHTGKGNSLHGQHVLELFILTEGDMEKNRGLHLFRGRVQWFGKMVRDSDEIRKYGERFVDRTVRISTEFEDLCVLCECLTKKKITEEILNN